MRSANASRGRPPELDKLLAANTAKSAREKLTLIRIIEDSRSRGYDSDYDAVRRYAWRWSKDRSEDFKPAVSRTKIETGASILRRYRHWYRPDRCVPADRLSASVGR